MPIVFVVGLTECVLAVPLYRYFQFTLKRCWEKQLAAEELRVLLVAFALFVSFNLQWGRLCAAAVFSQYCTCNRGPH